MIQSTWDKWFVQEEVEEAEPDGLSIWYLGCNGFILRTAQTTLYVDPYFGTGDHRPYAVRMLPVPMDPANATMCDGVLVTHEHVDHMHPPSYGPLLAKSDATLYAPATCFRSPDYEGDLQISDGQRQSVSPGEIFDIGDMTITVCGANDPDAREPVSYMIESKWGTFFHAGDSRLAPEFETIGETFNIDLGALAFGSKGTYFDPEAKKPTRTQWYMDGNQIIDACNALGLDRLLPTHHNMWKGFHASPAALHDNSSSSPHPKTIEIVEVGDRLELRQSGIVPPCYTRRGYDK